MSPEPKAGGRTHTYQFSHHFLLLVTCASAPTNKRSADVTSSTLKDLCVIKFLSKLKTQTNEDDSDAFLDLGMGSDLLSKADDILDLVSNLCNIQEKFFLCYDVTALYLVEQIYTNL
jgi:hypothetical protein